MGRSESGPATARAVDGGEGEPNGLAGVFGVALPSRYWLADAVVLFALAAYASVGAMFALVPALWVPTGATAASGASRSSGLSVAAAGAAVAVAALACAVLVARRLVRSCTGWPLAPALAVWLRAPLALLGGMLVRGAITPLALALGLLPLALMALDVPALRAAARRLRAAADLASTLTPTPIAQLPPAGPVLVEARIAVRRAPLTLHGEPWAWVQTRSLRPGTVHYLRRPPRLAQSQRPDWLMRVRRVPFDLADGAARLAVEVDGAQLAVSAAESPRTTRDDEVVFVAGLRDGDEVTAIGEVESGTGAPAGAAAPYRDAPPRLHPLWGEALFVLSAGTAPLVRRLRRAAVVERAAAASLLGLLGVYATLTVLAYVGPR
ncbi:MAG TPA: hypothetical protein VG389_14780 [Myxococcota bacterium]|jgi:hypothetical protein|nr:hypothetical protein [Myxococcota bacterium]